MTKKFFLDLLFIIIAAVMVLIACTKSSARSVKHKIDYCGQKQGYVDAKDYYRSGSKVSLIYDNVGTDMDYSFYLNGRFISANATEYGSAFRIDFIMPSFDVKFECVSEVTMIRGEVEEKEIPEEVMIADYFCAPTGLPDSYGGGHYELVLVQVNDENGNDSYRIDKYTKADDESIEIKVSFTADYKAVKQCRAIADEYGFYSWDIREDNISEDGAKVVCKYLAENGKTVRVSNDDMPQNGREAMQKIRDVLEAYVTEENKIA